MKKDRMSSFLEEPASQHAALCYRRTGSGALEVLLITSLDTGRWVLPKGWPKPSEPGADCALREAFEEAGVIGTCANLCLGSYVYDKLTGKGLSLPCSVQVHVIAVSHLEHKHPEQNLRRKQWFAPHEAAELVAEPSLQALLAGFGSGPISAH